MSSLAISRGDTAVERADSRVKSEPLEPATLSDLAVPMRRTKKPMPPTVYDAVSGKCVTSKRWATKSTNTLHDAVLAPEEVLFQSSDAPVRYHENDIYFENEYLPNSGDGIIPNSDLLDEVHSYASRFYEALALRAEQKFGRGQVAVDSQKRAKEMHGSLINARLLDERSMDETALIAFGILLEEASRQTLGSHGDLVFTEADEDDGDEEDEDAEDRAPKKDAVRVDRGETAVGSEAEEAESRHTDDEARQPVQKKLRLKRRKLSGKRQAFGSDE